MERSQQTIFLDRLHNSGWGSLYLGNPPENRLVERKKKRGVSVETAENGQPPRYLKSRTSLCLKKDLALLFRNSAYWQMASAPQLVEKELGNLLMGGK